MVGAPRLPQAADGSQAAMALAAVGSAIHPLVDAHPR